MKFFSKLLAVTLLAIHLAGAAEPADRPAVPPRIDGGAAWPAGLERNPASVLDPAAYGADYRFSLAAEPRPASWSLLLGALLSIGFIVGRRLAFS